ncbi:hypothetical protein TNCT_324021 [Trichonephila clavata]|uniref:Uncharacterized protein n=1 Tax=Trichonephila clavata TaxID=2740835 RepID=A0A8X6KDN5_TRICU|nr:hypothetical protein TNCT_324021 [Trichonephila clavata]
MQLSYQENERRNVFQSSRTILLIDYDIFPGDIYTNPIEGHRKTYENLYVGFLVRNTRNSGPYETFLFLPVSFHVVPSTKDGHPAKLRENHRI